ncbi:hypothetical protein [Catalinimonas niigatensis]|uniref:hypothetical protein n=1 Tax=Catalinimonas niigatensis TaxID=1397264 RepID=UPI00266503C3|nr:hypothetical protein [Catalinimonas niigatensis]WPP50392.1 hypothetical protein PZB72_27370 [Catalinimonas niigatensis]
MKKQIYIISIVSLLIISCEQTETRNELGSDAGTKYITDYQSAPKEVYEIIEAVAENIKIGSEKIRLLDSLPVDFTAYDFLESEEILKRYSDLEKIYSHQAELFKKSQEAKPYQLMPTKLLNFDLILSSSIDFDKPYEENREYFPSYIFYSPLITSDGKLAVISIDFVCYGCGQGSSFILMKENGKWVKIEEIQRWIE